MKTLMRYAILTLTILSLAVVPTLAQRAVLDGGGEPIAALLAAHKAWKFPPASIQIEGRSTRGAVTEPVRITATMQEEVRTEYGERQEKVQVASRTAFFKEDGAKITRQPTPSGFTQLDVTSVFLLARLANTPVRTSRTEAVTVKDAVLQKTAAGTGRTELHYGQYTVEDRLDLYVDSSGLLSRISRAFYQERPQLPTDAEDEEVLSLLRARAASGNTVRTKPPEIAATLEVIFSDYRDTGGVLLPYHIERYLKGRVIETIQVERYTVEVPSPASLFVPRRVK